ncbi:unnamed protein product [Strongylus vulgaris]|uniref:Uncharacterized protein n=1 Tax=Strongylus vulgaris TaxID=40348 RepID=A0A3P7LMF0_STRVU|nr:unnamed protein product [Strongylus vulgaris]
MSDEGPQPKKCAIAVRSPPPVQLRRSTRLRRLYHTDEHRAVSEELSTSLRPLRSGPRRRHQQTAERQSTPVQLPRNDHEGNFQQNERQQDCAGQSISVQPPATSCRVRSLDQSDKYKPHFKEQPPAEGPLRAVHLRRSTRRRPLNRDEPQIAFGDLPTPLHPPNSGQIERLHQTIELQMIPERQFAPMQPPASSRASSLDQSNKQQPRSKEQLTAERLPSVAQLRRSMRGRHHDHSINQLIASEDPPAPLEPSRSGRRAKLNQPAECHLNSKGQSMQLPGRCVRDPHQSNTHELQPKEQLIAETPTRAVQLRRGILGRRQGQHKDLLTPLEQSEGERRGSGNQFLEIQTSFENTPVQPLARSSRESSPEQYTKQPPEQPHTSDASATIAQPCTAISERGIYQPTEVKESIAILPYKT